LNVAHAIVLVRRLDEGILAQRKGFAVGHSPVVLGVTRGRASGKIFSYLQPSESNRLIRAVSADFFFIASCDEAKITNSGATFLRPRVAIRDDLDSA
jgi:hypothetical protein